MYRPGRALIESSRSASMAAEPPQAVSDGRTNADCVSIDAAIIGLVSRGVQLQLTSTHYTPTPVLICTADIGFCIVMNTTVFLFV